MRSHSSLRSPTAWRMSSSACTIASKLGRCAACSCQQRSIKCVYCACSRAISTQTRARPQHTHITAHARIQRGSQSTQHNGVSDLSHATINISHNNNNNNTYLSRWQASIGHASLNHLPQQQRIGKRVRLCARTAKLDRALRKGVPLSCTLHIAIATPQAPARTTSPPSQPRQPLHPAPHIPVCARRAR
jgi:hypothetical protein